MQNVDYKLLSALNAVVTEQSFEKAADKLAITQSAVSQRIKHLESTYAQPLLIRSQPIELTPLGEKLLKHFKQVELLEFQLREEISPTERASSLTVSIAVNADTLASWFIPAISPLLKTTDITLDLHLANEKKTQMLLNKGAVFAAISSQARAISGCKSTYLGNLPYVLVSSPEFKQRYFPNGLNAETLVNAPAVDFDPNDNMHASFIEEHFNVQAGQYPCHRVRSSEAFVFLALEGAAYTLLPITQANPHIAAGTLVNLLPKNPLIQKLYWHSWHLEQGIHREVSTRIINYASELLSEY